MEHTTAVRSIEPAQYTVTDDGDAIIAKAIEILGDRLKKPGVALEKPQACIEYLMLNTARHEREVFTVLFLDTRHRVIACEQIFLGTIDSATIHPREIVKRTLAHNAGAVILSHNHPSGIAEPSAADATITRRIQDALALVDVRVLDHIVIGGVTAVSMATIGMM